MGMKIAIRLISNHCANVYLVVKCCKYGCYGGFEVWM